MKTFPYLGHGYPHAKTAELGPGITAASQIIGDHRTELLAVGVKRLFHL